MSLERPYLDQCPPSSPKQRNLSNFSQILNLNYTFRALIDLKRVHFWQNVKILAQIGGSHYKEPNAMGHNECLWRNCSIMKWFGLFGSATYSIDSCQFTELEPWWSLAISSPIDTSKIDKNLNPIHMWLHYQGIAINPKWLVIPIWRSVFFVSTIPLRKSLIGQF